MADGCNLYFTEKDLIQVKESLHKGVSWNYKEETRVASNILRGRLLNNVEDFKEILVSVFDSRKVIVQKLLEKSLSQGQLNLKDEAKLSQALLTLLEREQKVAPIFQKQKTKSELFENLISEKYNKDKETASIKRGGALLTVASIIQSKEVSTSLGTTLSIQDNDIIGFGQKLPERYTPFKKNSSPLEADTLISRVTWDEPPIPPSYEMIGLDTKYLKKENNEKTYNYTKGLDIQLAGINESFKYPHFKEFYFVSNSSFGKDFKAKIEEFNFEKLKEKISIDDKFKKDFGEFVISGKGLLELDKIDTAIFKAENKEKYSALIKEYNIPQIGLCENVNVNDR